MSLSAKVGAFNTGTTSADIVVTGLGFQPKALILFWSGRTGSSDGAGAGTYTRGFGFATGSGSQACISSKSLHNQTTSDTDSAHSQTRIINVHSSTGSINGSASWASWDSDGFTLSVNTVFPSDYRIGYLALGGADLTNLATGRFQINTSTGSQAVTGVGFAPDCVMLISIDNASAPPVTAPTILSSIGIATKGGDRLLLFTEESNAQNPTISRSYCGDFGEVYARGIGSVLDRASMTSLDSDGFTLNVLETQGTVAAQIIYLALKGGQYKVLPVTTATDTNPFSVTGAGFPPRAGLFLSHGMSESTQDTIQNTDNWSVGAASAGGAVEQHAEAARSDNGVSPSTVSCGNEHDNVYLNLTSAGAVDGSMALTSFDTDGATFTMTNADPSGKFVGALFFGSNPAISITEGQICVEGQTINLLQTQSVDSGSLAVEGPDIALLFSAAYVIPVSPGDVTFEGQEIPFILTQPGAEGQLVVDGQQINMLALATVDVVTGQLAISNETINLVLTDSIIVDTGQIAIQSISGVDLVAQFTVSLPSNKHQRDQRRRGLLNWMYGRG